MARKVQLDETWQNTSVSSGTMRSEDLIPAFIDVLAITRKTLAAKYGVEWRKLAKRLAAAENLPFDAYQQVQFEASELTNTLFDELDSIAPDGTSFGAHPGDGSDYGFWAVESDESED